MHIASLGVAPPKGDEVSVLLAAQPSWVGDAFRRAIESTGAALSEMHYWRNRGDEEPSRRTRRVDPDWVGPAGDATRAVGRWVLDQLDLDAGVIEEHRRWLTDR